MARNDTTTQPIAANAMNLTRVTGLGAVVATTGTALSASLGAFEGLPIAIVIAVIAAVCVALVVAGYVLATDMRIRSEQTLYANRLSYLSKRDKKHSGPEQNGHDVKQLPPGAPPPVVPSGGEGGVIWHLVPVHIGTEAGETVSGR